MVTQVASEQQARDIYRKLIDATSAGQGRFEVNAANRERVLEEVRRRRAAGEIEVPEDVSLERLVTESLWAVRVARATDEDGFVAWATQNELPPIRLSAEEMEAAKGGGLWGLCLASPFAALGCAVIGIIAVAIIMY